MNKDKLNKMKPHEVLEHPEVKERFVKIHNHTHKSSEGELFYEEEKLNLLKVIASDTKGKLQSCSGFSVYSTFIDLASTGLSCKIQSNPLIYIQSRGVKNGNEWTQAMTMTISPYGELSLRIMLGHILYADQPTIVYEGDSFQPYEEKGGKFIDYKPQIPRKSKIIIAGYLKLTRHNNSVDYAYMLPEDWEHLATYSERQNSFGNKKGNANALYTSNNGQIDPGFLKAKLIKHAFKNYPKIKLSAYAKLSENEEYQASDYHLESDPDVSQTPMPDQKQKPFESSAPKIEKVDDGINIDIGDDDTPF